jgi:osmotically-inducible protein OsmY
MRHDHDLQKAVLEHLDFDPAITSSQIGVAVRDGVVTLSGHVPSFKDKARAETDAGLVRGVKAVVNEIRVDLPGHCESPDEVTARRAYDRLASNLSVPLDRIHIGVEGGVVTLHGDVDWQYQRLAAVEDLRQLDCVREIRNEIRIHPPIAAEDVSTRIQAALRRLGLTSADHIAVAANGSNVTLSGTVVSWHEKDVAETVAWSVPGISHVENKLMVT